MEVLHELYFMKTLSQVRKIGCWLQLAHIDITDSSYALLVYPLNPYSHRPQYVPHKRVLRDWWGICGCNSASISSRIVQTGQLRRIGYKNNEPMLPFSTDPGA
jgi:hypothetical protein